MADFPEVDAITPGGARVSVAEALLRIYGAPADLTDIIYTTANLAVYVPIFIREPFELNQLAHLNGSVLNGNVDIGIYHADEVTRVPRVRLGSSGSVAQAGANGWQYHNITNIFLPPGMYYMAFAMDNNVGRVRRLQPTTPSLTAINQGLGLLSEGAAFPLPATATAVLPGASVSPLMLASTF